MPLLIYLKLFSWLCTMLRLIIPRICPLVPQNPLCQACCSLSLAWLFSTRDQKLDKLTNKSDDYQELEEEYCFITEFINCNFWESDIISAIIVNFYLFYMIISQNHRTNLYTRMILCFFFEIQTGTKWNVTI